MPDLSAQSLWLNFAAFGIAAAAVWWAGTRLVFYADTIADKTGLSRGFIGLLPLAAVTSLPEIATTLSAAGLGAPRMAVNNLLGGVAMQTAILAVVDLLALRRALTGIAPSAAVLLQGVVLITLLGAAIATNAANLPAIGHVGSGTIAVFTLFVFGLLAAKKYEERPAWVPRAHDDRPDVAGEGQKRAVSIKRAVAMFVALAGAVLVAGWLVASTGHVIAERTGLGESFVGATLIAVSTSLPELSTTIAAARRGAVTMAISNVFGSNCFDVALLFLADVVHTDSPILRDADRSAAFAASLGVVLTAVYLWGLLERRDKPVWRMGIDSWVVLVLYGLGLVVLYGMRES